MIVEIAIFEAKPGEADQMREGLTRARDVISRSPGYRDSHFHQAIEKPERFVLSIEWEKLEDHTEGFRKGPLLAEWRSHWYRFLGNTPEVLHYQRFVGS